MDLRARLFGRAAKTDGPLAATAAAEASAFLTDLAEEISRGPLNLPCFPDIVPRVRKALADPRTRTEDIVRIVATEPRLTARLLQTANSAVFSPAGKTLMDLRGAVTRLGHHLVQSVTMVFAVQQMKAEAALRPLAKHLDQVWEKSIAVASICQVMANHLRVPADKVFLTGLLHRIGEFYIIVRSAQPASRLSYDRLPASLVAERHPALGRAVLTQWNFEAVMCEAVGSQNDHARTSKRAADIVDVVIASVVLADALFECNGDLTRAAGVTSFARLNLRPSDLQAIMKHTEHSLQSLREALAG